MSHPLKVFPNPASHELFMSYNAQEAAVTSLLIYDTNVRILKTKGFGKLPAGDCQLHQELDGFIPGQYFVQVSCEGGNGNIRMTRSFAFGGGECR